MADSPSVFDDLLKSAPPIKPASKSSVFDDLLSAAPPLKTVAPPSAEDDEDRSEKLPSSAYAGPTRYGRDAQGRLASVWQEGNKFSNKPGWYDLFTGKQTVTPHSEEMGPAPSGQSIGEPSAPSGPSIRGMEQLGGVPPGPPAPRLPSPPR